MPRPSPTPRIRRELLAFLLAGGLALLIVVLASRGGETSGTGASETSPEPVRVPAEAEAEVEP